MPGKRRRAASPSGSRRACLPAWPICRWARCRRLQGRRQRPASTLRAALALRGGVAALVTAPIHKEALSAAGVHFPGHTEMLQAAAGGAPVRMMLANDELRVVLVTIHMALRRAIDALDFDAVLSTLRIAHRSAAAWGQAAPRIAVAGLNPHAGEGGLFGDEEIRFIAPAVAAARSRRHRRAGPVCA